jgi:hypothetical protein
MKNQRPWRQFNDRADRNDWKKPATGILRLEEHSDIDAIHSRQIQVGLVGKRAFITPLFAMWPACWTQASMFRHFATAVLMIFLGALNILHSRLPFFCRVRGDLGHQIARYYCCLKKLSRQPLTLIA